MSTKTVKQNDVKEAVVPSNIVEYNERLEDINAVPDSEIMDITIPPSRLVGEAETLFNFAETDKEILVRSGLDPELIARLKSASGALRYSCGQLAKALKSEGEINAQWKTESQKGSKLRDELVHHFLFAYRDNAEVLSMVRMATKGYTNDDKIQHLVNLSAIGNEYRKELENVGFDFSLLDEASKMSALLGDILGKIKATGTDGVDGNAARLIRDKAYTYLKNIMDEIRRHGKYVFYRNQERLRGYTSAYNRRRRQSRTEVIPEAAEQREAA
jgi:hypothetical protein